MLRELSTFIFIFSLLVKLISDNFKILSIKLFISNVIELIIFKKFLFYSIEKFSKFAWMNQNNFGYLFCGRCEKIYD